MENKRPLGLTVIATVDLLIGFFITIGMLLGIIDLINKFKFYSADKLSMIFMIIVICISAILGLFLIRLGILTLKFNIKSKVGNIAVAVLGIVSCLSNLIFGHGYATPTDRDIFIFSIVSFPYFLWATFYLTRTRH